MYVRFIGTHRKRKLWGEDVHHAKDADDLFGHSDIRTTGHLMRLRNFTPRYVKKSGKVFARH